MKLVNSLIIGIISTPQAFRPIVGIQRWNIHAWVKVEQFWEINITGGCFLFNRVYFLLFNISGPKLLLREKPFFLRFRHQLPQTVVFWLQIRISRVLLHQTPTVHLICPTRSCPFLIVPLLPLLLPWLAQVVRRLFQPTWSLVTPKPLLPHPLRWIFPTCPPRKTLLLLNL